MKRWQVISYSNTTSQALLVKENSVWDTYSIGGQTKVFFLRMQANFCKANLVSDELICYS